MDGLVIRFASHASQGFVIDRKRPRVVHPLSTQGDLVSVRVTGDFLLGVHSSDQQKLGNRIILALLYSDEAQALMQHQRHFFDIRFFVTKFLAQSDFAVSVIDCFHEVSSHWINQHFVA